MAFTKAQVRANPVPKADFYSASPSKVQNGAGSIAGFNMGRLQRTRVRQLGEKMTRDNKITNRLVKKGKLPKSQMEIYKQK